MESTDSVITLHNKYYQTVPDVYIVIGRWYVYCWL